MKELEVITIIVIFVCLTIKLIFAMKFKKDMFIEYLKHEYPNTISDGIMMKIFKLEWKNKHGSKRDV